jgi:hypothetical protein
MRILSYSGESVVTTDRVGEAVVDYVRALIAVNSTDVVDIPVLFDEQELTASLVLGPTSQLIVCPCHDVDVHLQDDLAIARMHARTAALGPHEVVPSGSAELGTDELSFDFL